MDIRASDVNKAMVTRGLLPSSRLPNVCNALRGGDFLKLANVELVGKSGPYTGTTAIFRYRILNVVPDVAKQSEYKRNEILRKRIMKLSPSEFQELAREYLGSKGFDGVEMEITIRMKM